MILFTLDGRSQHGSISHAAELDHTSSFSLELWVKRSKNASLQALVGKPLSTNAKTQNYALWLDEQNKLRFEVGNGTEAATVTAAEPLDTGWHHVVATFASGTLALYLDGALSASAAAPFTSAAANTSPLQLGRAGTSHYYGGSLDELALYPTALTAAQIEDHYTRATNPPAPTTLRFAHDDNGNQTLAGTRSYSWNAAGQLVGSTLGLDTISYSHDGEGNRLTAILNGTLTESLWDTNAPLPLLALERDGQRQLLRRHLHGHDTISITTPAGSSYLHHDHLGSVTAVTDPAGAVQHTRAYEPFGPLRAETTAPTAPNVPLAYTGQYLDPATGLYNLRARHYDVSLGRFLSLDPLEGAITDATISAYAYGNNRPTMFVDPSGLRAEPSPAATEAAEFASSPEHAAVPPERSIARSSPPKGDHTEFGGNAVWLDDGYTRRLRNVRVLMRSCSNFGCNSVGAVSVSAEAILRGRRVDFRMQVSSTSLGRLVTPPIVRGRMKATCVDDRRGTVCGSQGYGGKRLYAGRFSFKGTVPRESRYDRGRFIPGRPSLDAGRYHLEFEWKWTVYGREWFMPDKYLPATPRISTPQFTCQMKARDYLDGSGDPCTWGG